MKKWQRVQLINEYCVDGTGLISSITLSYILFGVIMNKIMIYTINDWIQYLILLFAAYSAVFLCFSYSINLEKRGRMMEILSVFRNSALTYMLFAIFLLLFKNPIIDSRYLFVGSFILFFVFSCLGRYILKRVLTNNFSQSKNATLVGVITTEERADKFLSDLQKDWTKRIEGVAFIDSRTIAYTGEKAMHAANSVYTKPYPKNTSNKLNGITMLPDIESFLGWARLGSIDEVFINMPVLTAHALDTLIEELEDMGITVHINIPTLEQFVEGSKFNNISCDVVAGYPMASFAAATHNRQGLILKRTMDIVGSLVGLLISIPIILITAIPLCIESPGPLFFKQQRIGKNGRIFNMYKLRSMYVDAEERKKELESQNTMNGLMFKMDNDPRITKVGRFIRKFSIDELPQFFNVLIGDMSLVGTRPPTVSEFEQYSGHHKRRLSMRPGITGMWQVSGRSDIHDFEDVVQLDCEYIDNWSILLDIKILFKTLAVVLTAKGAK